MGAEREAHGLDAERLVGLLRVAAITPSPCGRWAALAVARLDADEAGYVHELWRVDLEDPAKPPRQLTRGPSDDRAPAFRSDGALGFLSNRSPSDGKPEEGDDERAQVWILPAGGGEPLPLTDEPLGVQGFRFAARGDLLVVVAGVLPGVAHDRQREVAADRKKHGPTALHYARAPVRFWDHWLPEACPHLIAFDAGGGDRRDLTPGALREHRDAHFDLSPDGARVVVTHRRPGEDRLDDRGLLVIDAATRAERLIAQPRTELEAPRFAPDGQRIACQRRVRSHERFGRVELWVFDGERDVEGSPVTPEWDRLPQLHGWDRAGRGLLATADDRGEVPVFRVDVAARSVERISSAQAGGSHGQLAPRPGSDELIGLRHRLLHPPEPFRVRLEPGAEPELLARLSGFTEEEGARIARVESLEATGARGDPVRAFLLRPAAHDPAGPQLPALLWIHGGPWGQWADGWHWRWNPLVPVSAGYAMVLPNPRGSTGVGQEFLEGVWGNSWGAECYADVMAVADRAAAHPALDGERMGAMGGSFGGYMTNWIGANTARFRCLVTHASLFSLSAFHGVTDSPPFWALQMGQTPYRDPESYDRYSPHRRIASWKSPTLVIHGERDFRVPISEALALFEALQAHGVESELLVFPDENHWILRPRNIRVWYERFLGFVGRHLGK